MATITASAVSGSSNSAQPNGNLESLGKRNYVRWDTPGVEEKTPNEDEDIQTVADQINTIQKAQFNLHRHAFSGISFFPSHLNEISDLFRYACSHAWYNKG